MVAVLWLDHQLQPDFVLDAPPSVLAGVVKVVHQRQVAAEERERARERAEDMKAAAEMHRVLGGAR